MEDKNRENTAMENIEVDIATLSDLPMDECQADETKGGDYVHFRARFGSTI